MPDMNPYCFTRQTSADLSAHYLNIVAARTVGLVDVASHAAAAYTLGPIGVLYNRPKAGQAATVACYGQAKVRAGGAIAVHKMLTTNGSGRAAEVASGEIMFGRALSAAVNDGDIIDVLLFPPVRCSGAI